MWTDPFAYAMVAAFWGVGWFLLTPLAGGVPGLGGASLAAVSVSGWLLWAVPRMVVHELGHLAAARLLGVRLASVRFGTGRQVLAFGTRVRFDVRVWPGGGGNALDPSYDPLFLARGRRVLVVLAGPLANVGVAAACLAVAGGWSLDTALVGFGHGDAFDQVLLVVALGNLYAAVRSLVPVGLTDGVGVRDLLTMRPDPLFAAGLVQTYLDLDRREYALAVARALPAADPLPAVVRYWQARGFFDSARYDDARAVVHAPRQAAEAELQAELDNLLAMIELNAGEAARYADAVAVSARAVALAPEVVVYRAVHGWALVEAGQPSAGLALVREVLRGPALPPSVGATVLCVAAIAEARLGAPDEARRYVGGARALDPACSLLHRAEAALGAGA
jgi:hypothetical protein